MFIHYLLYIIKLLCRFRFGRVIHIISFSIFFFPFFHRSYNHSYTVRFYDYNLTHHCLNYLWQRPSPPLLKVLTKPVAWLNPEKHAAIQFKHVFPINFGTHAEEIRVYTRAKSIDSFYINSDHISYL